MPWCRRAPGHLLSQCCVHNYFIMLMMHSLFIFVVSHRVLDTIMCLHSYLAGCQNLDRVISPMPHAPLEKSTNIFPGSRKTNISDVFLTELCSAFLQFPARVCPVFSIQHIEAWTKMAAILQTAFWKCSFVWRNCHIIYSEFHLSLFLRIKLTKKSALTEQWHGTGQMTSHYLNQWWPNSLTDS